MADLDRGPALEAIVGGLDAEQRAAALLPDGPAQIVAPAGSGKTTTLIARLGVLLLRGIAPDRICVVTFNRAAAVDLAGRISTRLAVACAEAAQIEVRTLHALARRVLVEAGQTTNVVSDRLPLLRSARRAAARLNGAGSSDALPDVAAVDVALSAWRIEGRAPPHEMRGVLDVYEHLLRARGVIDFDDMVVRAIELLTTDSALCDRWQRRFSHLCVDEFQDVDAAQLRLVRLLAAPQDNLFVVGDDDQTIYAWRLADVRRMLSFGTAYPTAARVQLATNYRCPPSVVSASVRLVSQNRERFTKRIVPAAGREGEPDIAALPGPMHETAPWLVGLARAHHAQGRSLGVLARTRSDLEPLMAELLRAGVPHAASLVPHLLSDVAQQLLSDVRGTEAAPFEALDAARGRLGWRRGAESADDLADDDHAALDALLGWATLFSDTDDLLRACERARKRLRELVSADAPVELVTVHAAKGREWETVVILGFEEERFPNRRALVDADDASRALEEERRLAYVALTRATRRLLVVFDVACPSRFLTEMGYSVRTRPRTAR